MLDFHTQKQRYFDMQYQNSKEYIVPFVAQHVDLSQPINVLEIGSAEAGVLKAFTELGHTCLGIELMEHRVEFAKQFMAKELEEGKINFISKNIYDINPDTDLEFKFDLIILKDVIEHIHDQAKFMVKLGDFLAPNGKVFFGFPPWQMPFGGHQQLATKKITSKLPYYHLLPMFAFKGMLKIAGEPQNSIDVLTEIKETGISIERFERICKQNNFKITRKKFYLINPIYKWKFNLKPRKQFGFLSKLPFLRNYLTTAVYYLIEKK